MQVNEDQKLKVNYLFKFNYAHLNNFKLHK